VCDLPWGRTRPTTLVQELTWAVEEGGAEAMTARYAELRERYFGSGTLDFGVGTLTAVAQKLGRLGPGAGSRRLTARPARYS